MGVRWAGEVSEFVDRTVRAQDDQLAQRESALTKDFRGVIQWIVVKARLLPSLKDAKQSRFIQVRHCLLR